MAARLSSNAKLDGRPGLTTLRIAKRLPFQHDGVMSSTLFRSLALPALAYCASVSAAAEDLALASAQECRPRAGLPHFFAKVKQPGAEIRIGYLGGSITAQAGWRPKTLAHFQASYPQASFTEINAAIGGTGSDLGVCRLQQDVLDHKPDLLFIEFAVNDGGAHPDQIFRCMEGIVRQTWRALPECDICFVYTLTEALAPAMLEGKFQRSASAMEKIADHYGIPTIHMAMEVAKLASEGRLLWKAPLPKTAEEKIALGDKVVFAPDSVHPHINTGHELYLQAIVRSLKPIEAASTSPRSATLPEPFIATHYEQAKLVPLPSALLTEGFRQLDPVTDDFGKRWAKRMTSLHKADQPGQVLHFKFKGTRCAIYDVIGPDCGQLTVTLDDLPPRVVSRFDSHSTYHRLSSFMIGTEMEDKVHEVKIEIHPEAPDKTKILAQRNQTIDKPERYQGTAFYPGAILLVGELVE